MAIVGNRAHETSTTTGTGPYSLGGAVADRLTLVQAAARASGDNVGPWQVEYLVQSGADYEQGVGTLTAGAPATLTRDTILDSSNGGAAVSWGAGTRDVILAPGARSLNKLLGATSTATADTIVLRDASGRFKAAAPVAPDDVARKAETDAASAATAAAQADADAAQSAAAAAQADIDAHAARVDNPHAVTKAQVGLANVVNQVQAYFAAASLAANGYVRLTDGSNTLIVQWGFSASGTSTRAITFPLAFPNAVFSIVTQEVGTASGEFNALVSNVSLTGFDLAISSLWSAYWIAIGH